MFKIKQEELTTKSRYISDLLNYAERSGVAYFTDEFGQTWKIQKIIVKEELMEEEARDKAVEFKNDVRNEKAIVLDDDLPDWEADHEDEE